MMGLNPLIIFMHMLNDSFLSSYKRSELCLDHILSSCRALLGSPDIAHETGTKLHFSIAFAIKRSRTFACFCASGHLVFENHSSFEHDINRLSYSCGLWIALFQILCAIVL